MSTLGGSRGERNAKPKFSALDINRMYKNSRGETTETSTQKSQVPRKHGMQSLGKVPSARRPPANLPSLKAEITNSPIVNNNSVTPTGQDVGASANGTQSTQGIASIATANQQLSTTAIKNKSQLGNNSINNNNKLINNNNNTSVVGIGSKLINNSSTSGIGGTQQLRNSSATTNHANQQQNSPITWSAVTTGNDSKGGGAGGKSSVPPLYQSPQFQFEFPTLDGTVGGSGSGGVASNKKDHYHQQQQQNAHHHHHQQQPHHQQHHHHQQQQNHQNYHPHQRDFHHGRQQAYEQRHDAQNSYRDGNDVDGVHGQSNAHVGDQQRDFNEVSLRPQTDPAAWLLQQEKAAKGVTAEGALNQQGQGPQATASGGGGAAVPLPILSLMPSFMQRGAPLPAGGSVGSTGGRPQTPPNYSNGIGKEGNQQPLGAGPMRTQRPPPQHINNQAGNFRNAAAIPKRPPSMATPPLGTAGQSANGASGSRKDKEFIVEPEVAQMQRPIIREEDLERLNALAKDDSWTKQDDIDYTKKLTFSDDESPEEPSPVQERDRPAFNKSGSAGSTGTDQRKNSNASAGSASGNWQQRSKEQRDSLDREKSVERDETRQPQNGHRNAVQGGIALDASVYERVKQRKEEEERREMERKQAAAKKLQELEMKMKKANVTGAGGDTTAQPQPQTVVGVTADEDYHTQQQSQIRRNGPGGGRNSAEFDRGQRFDMRDSRGGGDYTRNNDRRGVGGPGAVTGDGKVFSQHFQLNLPPRFQRQQQMQAQQGSSSAPSTTTVGSGGNVRPTNTPAIGVEKSNSSSTYDSGRFGQKSGPQRAGQGNRGEYREGYNRIGSSGSGYGRNRNDSEREDEQRYHGRAREDYGRGSQNQLARSISETSQRKTSVSSNDDSVKFAIGGDCKDFGSGALGSSWAEETDTELKRQRDESFSSSHSQDSIPIKILQRPHSVQKSLSEEEASLTDSLHQRVSESEQSHFLPMHMTRRSESGDEKPQAIQSHVNLPEEAKISAEPIQQPSESINSIESQKKRKENESSNAGGTVNSSVTTTGAGRIDQSIVLDEKQTDSRTNTQPLTQRDPKRPSPRRGGGRDRDRDKDRERDRGSHTRSYGGGSSYRGGRDTWSSRNSGHGGRGSRYYGSNDPHESEHSEDIDERRRAERSPKMQRKDQNSRRGGGPSAGSGSDERNTKEGFAPRGEPSRRGRGAGGNVVDRGSSSYNRRGNDGRGNSSSGRHYGRHNYEGHKDKRNSESEQSAANSSGEVDKTKQNQMALSAGLNKVKDTTGSDENKQATAGKQPSPPGGVLGSNQPKKSNEPEKKNSTTAPPKQFGSNITEGTAGFKGPEQDREKKSGSKEKDVPSIVSTPLMQQRSSSNTSITPTKKQDLPMASASLPPTTQSSTSVKSTQQQHSVPKPPPGLGGAFKGSGISTSSSASAISTNSTQTPQQQKQCAELQKSKSETCGISTANNNNRQQQPRGSISEVDKNKLNSTNLAVSGNEKAVSSGGSIMLEGTPVNTIIFENTNYKQQAQAAAQIKRSSESLAIASSASAGSLASVSAVDTLTNALSQMTFAKSSEASTNAGGASATDYEKDMKLGFSFGDASESYGNATGQNVNEPDQNKCTAGVPQPNVQPAVCQPHQQQQHQQAQNLISTEELNMKIASVKKVWETVSPMSLQCENDNGSLQQQHAHSHQQQQIQPPSQQQQQLEVVDANGHMSAASFVAAAVAASQQHQQQQQQQHLPHYAVAAVHMQQHHSLSSPGPVQNPYGSHGSPFDTAQLEQQYAQSGSIIVSTDDNVVGYPSPQQQQQSSSQQQVLKHQDAVKQQQQQQQVTAATKQMQQHHGSSMGMSPPPNLQQQQQHQQSAAQQQQQQLHAAPQPYYQTSTQFTGIPTIPSPPAVVFNSAQMPPPPSQGGIYAPFHSLDHSSRSQFSAAAAHSFPGHYSAAAAAAAGGPFNAYAMQTPPNMGTPPTPEMYSNLSSQFRMSSGHSPFGNPNSQQLSNPNAAAAVAIISSNSNSLMSSVGSVKPPPSSQQLGTIGSKGSGGAGSFNAQHYMNLYAGPPPQHPQGGPPTAHQLQSNSYYSNSAGGPNGPFYGGPPPQSAAGSAQSYGLAAAAAAAAGLYGGHGGHQGGPPGSNGPQGPGPQTQHTMSSFNTQFMNTPLLTAAAINQFRGGPTPQQAAAAAYMKSSQGQSHLQDSMGRQLKSPLSADVSLNLAKQVQSQASPPHHKNYSSWELQNQVMQQQQAQQSQSQQQQAAQQRAGAANSQNINSNNRSAGGGPPGSQGGSGSGGPGRYPTPIQRPTNYPQHTQGGPQAQQQQNQGQRSQSMRQQGNNGSGNGGGGNGHQVGPGGPNNGSGGGSGPGGPNGNGSNNGASGQQPPLNKNTPYYANNSSGGGPNRANHS